MPYIDKHRKQAIQEGDRPRSAGELCYCLVVELNRYITDHGNFQGMSDALGALEAAKLETYRRLVAPHEDAKLLENGDVYD